MMRKVGAVVLGAAFYAPIPIWLLYLAYACGGVFAW
jgi:hypothetical protein